MENKILTLTENLCIGMIHVDALPGTPNYNGDVKSIIKKAKEEAKIYMDAGIDSIMIENMHDVPYLRNHIGPEITSLMSIIGYEIKNLTDLPTGIQILAGANKEALAAANSAGLDFVRAEGFVFAHVADEGIIESNAGELLRYRKIIGAENIAVFTDIKKKHSSHSITEDVSLVETAKAADFFMSDGLILTGKSTGEEADIDEIKSVKENVKLPVLVGSGVTLENVEKYFNIADGFIIGSHFKHDGRWENKVNFEKVKKFMNRVHELRIES
ncbi:putative sgc region protein SgcQ [bacterium BMS3Abin04]|nr:putative sgc region protein SgcQ [bacterium BMS3Abin04]